MIGFSRLGLGRPGLAAFSVVTAVLIGAPLFAQEPVPPPPVGPTPAGVAQAPAGIVTGANIPTAEKGGPNPVDTYNPENMNKSGDGTTEQFFHSLPTGKAKDVPIS